MKIVSMAPNITEAVFYLGCSDSLVGRTSFCNKPDAALQIPVAGTFTDIDQEMLISLNPDIVLFSGNLTDKAGQFLDNYGIRYEDIAMDDIESVIAGMNKMGEMFNALDKAVAFTDSVNMALNNQQTSLARVYIEISARPLMAVTKKGYLGDILASMGCTVFGNGDKPYVTAEQEDIVSFNPEIIIVLSKDSKLPQRAGWESIDAVDNYSVHICDNYDTDLFSRPGPSLIKAIDRAGDIIEALE